MAGLSLKPQDKKMDETPSQEEVSLRQLPKILFGQVVKAAVSARSEQDQDMAPPPEEVPGDENEDEEMAPPPEEVPGDENEDEEEDEEMNSQQNVGSKRGRSRESTPEQRNKRVCNPDNDNLGTRALRRNTEGYPLFSPGPEIGD